MRYAARLGIFKWPADHRNVDQDVVDVLHQKFLGKAIRVVVCSTDIPIDVPHDVGSVAILTVASMISRIERVSVEDFP